MKKILLSSLLILIIYNTGLAQQEKGIIGYKNWLNSWTEFNPSKIDYTTPTKILSGTINTNTKLLKEYTYLLLGDVIVTGCTDLEIEPGTIIMGDFKTKGSLIISKGARIIAEGNKTDPIIFTSSNAIKRAGDWGGLFILGDAPLNNGAEAIIKYDFNITNNEQTSYGGDNPESNSGVLSYIRIEYSGKRTKNSGYYNALTLAGVGTKTILNNIMLSHSKGSALNILGGDLELTKIISYMSNNTDYMVNFGAQCKISNSLAIRSPYVSSAEPTPCMKIQNQKINQETSILQTKVTANNLTLVNLSRDLDYDIQIGLVNEAIYLGDNVTFRIDKSVLSGFNPAVIFDKKITINNENLDQIVFNETYFNNCNGNIFIKGKKNNEDLENWYGSRTFNNVYSKDADSEIFINPNSTKKPDYRLIINRITGLNN